MEDFVRKRLEVCKTCPLYKKQWDGNHRCNGQLYMDPKTKKTSFLPRDGYVRGCSCIVEYKARNIKSTCVAGLWES